MAVPMRCLLVVIGVVAMTTSSDVVELLEEDVAGPIPFTPLSKVKALAKVATPAPSKKAKAAKAKKKNEHAKAKAKAAEAETAKRIKKKGAKYKKIADTLMGKRAGKTSEKTATKAAHESVELEALKEAKKECNALLKDAKDKCGDMIQGKKNPKSSKIMSHAAADIKRQQKNVKAQVKADSAAAKGFRTQTHVEDKLGPAHHTHKMKAGKEPNTHVEDKLGPDSPYELGSNGVYKGPKSPLCDKLFSSVTTKCNALLRVAQPDTRDHFDSKKIQEIFAMYKRYQKEAAANMAKIPKA